MNIIDILVLIIIGVSVFYGMHRGFISGVLSVAALIGALVGLGAAAAIVKGTEKFRRGKAEWAPQLKEIIAAKQNKE